MRKKTEQRAGFGFATLAEKYIFAATSTQNPFRGGDFGRFYQASTPVRAAETRPCAAIDDLCCGSSFASFLNCDISFEKHKFHDGPSLRTSVPPIK
jgi:hypothetical protein